MYTRQCIFMQDENECKYGHVVIQGHVASGKSFFLLKVLGQALLDNTEQENKSDARRNNL
ncbi:hypothetical protein DOD53_13410 [Shigella flexneri]|nr:hypothetical protein [Shigella flexneri]